MKFGKHLVIECANCGLRRNIKNKTVPCDACCHEKHWLIEYPKTFCFLNLTPQEERDRFDEDYYKYYSEIVKIHYEDFTCEGVKK